MLKRTPFGYTGSLEVENGHLVVSITRINESKDELSAFMKLTLFTAGREIVLYMGKFNFMASRTRKELANYLNRLNPIRDGSWQEIIEKIAQEFIEKYYQPDPAVRIQPVEYTHTEFIIYPVIPQGHPTLLYAPGGSGKSFLAMYLTLLVRNGRGLNGETSEPSEVLYCDWEMDINEAQRRFTMLAVNFEEVEYPLYRRCIHPLQDELESIMNDVSENNVKFVVMDSAAPAIGGDINNAEKVIQFFNCIRQLTTLGASVLILTHVSKAHKERDDPLPVGSIFFENLSRMTWELKYTYKDEAYDMTLINRKTNFGKMPALGINITFLDGCAYVNKAETTEMSMDGTQKEVVLNVLKYNTEMEVKNLAQMTGIDKKRLWVILTQLKTEGHVVNTGRGTWKFIPDEEY